MKNTRHIQQRKIERRIDESIIEMALQYGRYLSQNNYRLIFGRKDLKYLEEKKALSKREVMLFEKKLGDRTIILVTDGVSAITAFWENGRINKRHVH